MRMHQSLFTFATLASMAFATLAIQIPGVRFTTPLMNIVAYGPKAQKPKGDGVVIAKLDPTVKPPAKITDEKLAVATQEAEKLEAAQKDKSKGWIATIWSSTTDTTVYIAGTATTGVVAVANVATHAQGLLTDAVTGYPDMITTLLTGVVTEVKKDIGTAVKEQLFPKNAGYLMQLVGLAVTIVKAFNWLQLEEIKDISVAVVLPQVKTSAPIGVGFLLTDFTATLKAKWQPPLVRLTDGDFEYKFRAAGINVVGSIVGGKFVISVCEGAIYSNFEFNKGSGLLGGAVALVDGVSYPVQYYAGYLIRQAACGATAVIVNEAFKKSAEIATNVVSYATSPTAWAKTAQQAVPGPFRKHELNFNCREFTRTSGKCECSDKNA